MNVSYSNKIKNWYKNHKLKLTYEQVNNTTNFLYTKKTILKITEFGSTSLVSRLVFFFDKRYPCPAVIFSLVDVGLIDGWFILLWFVCRLQQSC